MQIQDIQPQHESLIKNLYDFSHGDASAGARMADRVVQLLGSWQFIIIQSLVLVAWTLLNMFAWFEHWDPYPFILLNLFLSLQSAYAAPIIMMSQNRQNARDRIEAHRDFLINQKAEKEIHYLIKKVDAQEKKIEDLHRIIIELHSMMKK